MFEVFLHEIRNNLTNGKIVVVFILMTVAFLVSLGMMHQEYESRLENYNTSQSLPSKELFWNRTWFYVYPDGSVSASDNATMPMGKVKKPDPMMFISRGMDTEMRQAVEFVKDWPIIDISTQPDQERNMLRLLYSAPDLLFMIKILVSLLAMIFAFDMICGERKQGTLKLMLTTGISRTAIFGGKYFGGLFSITTAFSAAFIIYILTLSTLGPLDMDGETLTRIGIIYVAGVMHIIVFFSIAAAVSTFSRAPGPALVVTLFFWLLIVFILPGLSSLMAKQFVPVDSDERVARMKFEKATSMERAYGEAHPEADYSTTGGYGRRYDVIRDQIAAELKKIEDENERKKDLQMDLTSNLVRVSPIGSLSYVIYTLCRTGLYDYALFKDDLHVAKRTIEQEVSAAFKNPQIMMLFMVPGFDIREGAGELIDEFLDMTRVFEFRESRLDESLPLIWLDFGLLAFFALVTIAVAYIRLLFYDVR